jgi:alanyl-tRNA synthetase
MTLTGNQIRQLFLDYFASKEHTIVKSSNLVPANDPTLYFTNAGMVQFKNTFTGQEKRNYVRATSSQKCMRVSGKHNDLENVGRTARHHTFFEMLGNFSFGDYFKSEACAFAWEFLTQKLSLPADKLFVTIFDDDDEAYAIWLNDVGVKKERLVRMGEKDNFWSMGDTGPCGPCSEIIYEQDIPCTLNNPDCAMGTCDCDRFLEVWNLVFMQFERHADGSKTPLPKPSIDTGMGLERLTAVLQSKASNYDCDLFSPILDEIEKIVQKKYTPGDTSEDAVSMRVIADHIRASVFLISDGVLPSNEGRGYVLRRILRRAIRHGKLLGQTTPFFYRLVPVIIKEMGNAFSELVTNQNTVEKIIKAEEERFFDTLEKGLKLLAEEIENHKKKNLTELTGQVAFKLYDTFGFPLDLTEIILAEHKFTIDQAGFDAAMTEQKERARAGWKGSGETGLGSLHLKLSEKLKTSFIGYDALTADSKVLAIIKDGKEADHVTAGTFEFICDQTPLYAESGGQVGDQGTAQNSKTKITITDTKKPTSELFVHKAKIVEGSLTIGDTLQLKVSDQTRRAITRNHTATHIMHAALRKRLGSHVRQAGSYVNDKILRFDFSHFEAIDHNTIKEIETSVNEIILADIPVVKEVTSYDEAIKKGALAFFGDKYDDDVRVITMNDYSAELCGGTHVNKTSEIGSFRILSEGSIAAGVRRIEATTGLEVIKGTQKDAETLSQLTHSLKTTTEDLPDKIDKLKLKIKTQDKEIEKLKNDLLQGGTEDVLKNTLTINDVKVVLHTTQAASDIRNVAIAIRDKLKSGIAVVSSQDAKKAIIVVTVTTDLQQSYPAQKVLNPLAELIGGRGGGKADIAQAGGTKIDELDKIPTVIKNFIENGR